MHYPLNGDLLLLEAQRRIKILQEEATQARLLKEAQKPLGELHGEPALPAPCCPAACCP